MRLSLKPRACSLGGTFKSGCAKEFSRAKAFISNDSLLYIHIFTCRSLCCAHFYTHRQDFPSSRLYSFSASIYRCRVPTQYLHLFFAQREKRSLNNYLYRRFYSVRAANVFPPHIRVIYDLSKKIYQYIPIHTHNVAGISKINQ